MPTRDAADPAAARVDGAPYAAWCWPAADRWPPCSRPPPCSPASTSCGLPARDRGGADGGPRPAGRHRPDRRRRDHGRRSPPARHPAASPETRSDACSPHRCEPASRSPTCAWSGHHSPRRTPDRWPCPCDSPTPRWRRCSGRRPHRPGRRRPPGRPLCPGRGHRSRRRGAPWAPATTTTAAALPGRLVVLAAPEAVDRGDGPGGRHRVPDLHLRPLACPCAMTGSRTSSCAATSSSSQSR